MTQLIDTEELDTAAIALVSYQLYEARGCEDGHDLEDWLAAEAQLREGHRGGDIVPTEA